MTDPSSVALFSDDPYAFFGGSYTAMMSIAPDELEAPQLAGLQRRFAQMKDSIDFLHKFVENQGLEEIEHLNDVVPILFQHTVYKSYPPSLIKNNNFAALTKWIDKLTTGRVGHHDPTFSFVPQAAITSHCVQQHIPE